MPAYTVNAACRITPTLPVPATKMPRRRRRGMIDRKRERVCYAAFFCKEVERISSALSRSTFSTAATSRTMRSRADS